MFKLALTIVGLAALASAAPADDKVDQLDQMPDLTFGLYSGYVPINGTKKELHYMAALSKQDPSKDPVIIWFNGGPGCSSMLGWAQEHGPYVMEDGTNYFQKNDYSWNNEATMIYIEAPAGVGYSICPDTTECQWDDNNSADDNLVAVLNLFLMKFPELQGNDLWVSGESYAGIYVPQLVRRIDKYITDNKGKGFVPNLKGFLVGNGVTNWKYDGTPAYLEMAYWHGLYDDVLYQNMKAKCDYSYIDVDGTDNLSDECKGYLSEFQSLTNRINEYDVFGKCYTNSSSLQLHSSKHAGLLRVGNEIKPYKKYFTASEFTGFLKGRKPVKGSNLKEVPPCVYAKPIYDYLNNATNRKNMHIPETAKPWDLCSDEKSFNYTDQRNATVWIYPDMVQKYRVLKYSGDADGAVPTYGTQQWIADQNWTITESWYPYTLEGQVGGYVQEYGNFTFATVHGAGHMAPQWRRPQTYHVIFNFIKNKKI